MIDRLSFPPKLISVLCVIQVTAIVTGILLTGVFLKAESTIWEMTYSYGIAQFVRFHGAVFLLVPLAWSLWAILKDKRGSRVIEIDSAEGLIGIGLTAVVVLFFAWTTLHAMDVATMRHGPMTIISFEP